MSPRTRIIGFSITMSFILIYAYLLGMFDGFSREVLDHPMSRSIAILIILGVIGHIILEALKYFQIVSHGVVAFLHRGLFILLIIAGTYLVVR